MATTGRYLYGLIRTSQDLEFGDIGLVHDGAPARVYTVRVGAAAAIVSELPATQKVLPLRRNLEPHHAVIREVMKTATIVPVAFGHVARSEAAIVRMLRRNSAGIREQLDRVDGRVEMALKVRWNVENLFAYFVESDRELRAFRDQLYRGPRAPAPADKLELGRMFEDRLEREREDQRERVVELLRGCCSDVQANTPGHEALVMDLAFLVAREDLAAFEAQVVQAAGTFPAHYVFDYSGPWAPFHFGGSRWD